VVFTDAADLMTRGRNPINFEFNLATPLYSPSNMFAWCVGFVKPNLVYLKRNLMVPPRPLPTCRYNDDGTGGRESK
jgi:hypothetical protein